jgi:hypothetical protein
MGLTSLVILLLACVWCLHDNSAPSRLAGWEMLETLWLVGVLYMAIVGPLPTAYRGSDGDDEPTVDGAMRTRPYRGPGPFTRAAAASAYLVLLTLAALPVLCLAYAFGEISVDEVVRVAGSMLTAGLMYMAIGALAYRMVGPIGNAVLLAYLIAGGLFILPWLSYDYTGPMALAISPPIEPLTYPFYGYDTADQLASSTAMAIRLGIAFCLVLAAGMGQGGWRTGSAD